MTALSAAPLVRPVFLLGSHKSGSSLLRSLLDGHPDLAVLPLETHYFQYGGYWVDYPLRRAWPADLKREQLIASLTRFVEARNRQDDPFGDSILTGRLDAERARRVLDSCPLDTPKAQLEAYMTALHWALHGAPPAPAARIVEKSVENTEYAPVLQRMFPDAFFVHIVRNPYACLVALRRAKARPRYPMLQDSVLSIANAFHHLYKNERSLDRLLVVRYEDLVQLTEPTMATVAAFLQIPFLDSLLKPTLLGEPWGGNSSRRQTFSAVDNNPVDAWRQDITPVEARMVDRALGPVLPRYGYERIGIGKRWVLPARGERLPIYLQNRAFAWTL